MSSLADGESHLEAEQGNFVKEGNKISQWRDLLKLEVRFNDRLVHTLNGFSGMPILVEYIGSLSLCRCSAPLIVEFK